MPKARTTRGTTSLSELSKMSVELRMARLIDSWEKEIAMRSPNSSKSKNSSPAVVTSTMPDALTRRLTIVTFSEPKKTPEKNGVQ